MFFEMSKEWDWFFNFLISSLFVASLVTTCNSLRQVTRIREILRHIGIGMMKQLDFLLCIKEREKSWWEFGDHSPSLKLTASLHLKWMVGRRLFASGMAFRQVRTVIFREGKILDLDESWTTWSSKVMELESLLAKTPPQNPTGVWVSLIIHIGSH